jgi:hypothetical protein
MEEPSFQLFSDLHLEMCESFPLIERTRPILVLAGDIGHLTSHTFRAFMKYCSDTWENVLFVPGNREYYSTEITYSSLWNQYEQFCATFGNVHFMDGHVVEISGTVFFGATMWTPINPQWEDGQERVKAFDQTIACWDQLQALTVFLEKYQHHPNKVLITHFPIVREHTTHPKYDSQPEHKKRYFSTNWLNVLPKRLLHGVKTVCSGHTHHSFRLYAGHVRVISNQMGYPHELDPEFVSDGVV